MCLQNIFLYNLKYICKSQLLFIYLCQNKKHKMSIVNETEAEELLNPHFPVLRGIMDESIGELNDVMNSLSATLNTTTKCRMLLDLAIGRLKRHFEGVTSVRLIAKHQSIQIVFGQKIVARIKKLNKNGKSSNTPTPTIQAMQAQQLSLDLNTPSPTWIDLNYKVDTSWLGFESLAAVCRLNDTQQWKIEYNNINESTIVVPAASNAGPTVKEEKQITIKKKEA